MGISHGKSQEIREVQALSNGSRAGTTGTSSHQGRESTRIDNDRRGSGSDSGSSREKRGKTGYVYLIGPVSVCYKIGVSRRPTKRLYALNLPDDATVMHTIPSVAPFRIERLMHQAFAHRSVRGVVNCGGREWFRLDDSEIAAIISVPFADSERDLPASVIALREANCKPKFHCGHRTPGTRSIGIELAEPLAKEKLSTSITKSQKKSPKWWRLSPSTASSRGEPLSRKPCGNTAARR